MKTIAFFVITFFFSNIILGQYNVRFEVKQSASDHIADSIYVAGNFNNWDASSKDHDFAITQRGTASLNICITCRKI